MKFSEIEPTEIEWLWQGRIARGMLTILEGDPGVGKGFLLTDIIARLTRGLPMPDETTNRPDDSTTQRPPGNVLLCTDEESRARTLVPRAIAAGADLDRIQCMGGVVRWRRKLEELAQAAAIQMKQALAGEKVDLVVLDPLDDVIPGFAVADGTSARLALEEIISFGRRENCGLVVIRHPSKRGGSALHRGAGSLALSATARMIFSIYRDPLDPSGAVIACVKNNLVQRPPSLKFAIVPAMAGKIDAGKVEWRGVCEATADELAHQRRERSDTCAGKAELFLLELLDGGPLPIKSILEKARANAISDTTLWRAKRNLALKSTKSGFGHGAWSWSLPE